MGQCLDCQKVNGLSWAKRHREQRRESVRVYSARPETKLRLIMLSRFRKYGITAAEQRTLFAAQGGCCANRACRKHLTLQSAHVDHDHKTGQVRGFLCGKCNWALGYVDDSPAICRGLADYLEDHQPQLRLVESPKAAEPSG
jgi:hypothetical protein